MKGNAEAVAAHLSYRREQVALEEIRIRYDVGLLVRHLRSSLSGAAQARALAELGKRLDLRVSSLRQLGRIAGVLDAEEFDRYLAARGPRGFLLSFSHLEEIATVREPALRQRLAQVAVDEGLSVRRLSMHKGAAL